MHLPAIRLLLSAAIVAGFAGDASAATYKDLILSGNPKYYWTFDEPDAVAGGAVGDALNYGNGNGGRLVQGMGTTRVASATTAGGLSLGSAVSLGGGVGSENQLHTGSINTVNGVQEGDALGDIGGLYDSYAIEFWINPQANINEGYISEVGVSINAPSLIYGYGSSNLEIFANGKSGNHGRTGDAMDDDGFALNEWYHVVVGYKDNGASGDLTTFFVNGQQVATSTGVSNRTFDAENEHFFLGNSNNANNPIQALLDEYAVYDYSDLDQAQFDLALAGLASHFSAAAVPEPSTYALGLLGAVGLVVCARRFRKR